MVLGVLAIGPAVSVEKVEGVLAGLFAEVPAGLGFELEKFGRLTELNIFYLLRFYIFRILHIYKNDIKCSISKRAFFVTKLNKKF